MAIYSCSVKVHSRSKGETATGGACYRLGLAMTDERTGLRFDYSRRTDVASAFTVVPEKAPIGWDKPDVLWNEAEQAEKRINSCVSREVLVALPHEMTDPQREQLAEGMAWALVQKYGVGVSVGIHRPEQGEKNFHAHMLMTTRRIGPEGFGEKTRELDDKKTGSGEVVEIRQMVERHTNEALRKHGIEASIDHRSLADQQQIALENEDHEKAAELSRMPTKHEGRNPAVKERVAKENAQIRAENEQAHREFEQLLAVAIQEGRAMEPATDTKPKSQAELLKAQHASETEAMKDVVARALREAHEAMTKADEAEREWQRVRHNRDWLAQERDEAKQRKSTLSYPFNMHVDRANEWVEKHPLLAWVYTPDRVKESRAKALELKEQMDAEQAKADEFEKRRVASRPAQQELSTLKDTAEVEAKEKRAFASAVQEQQKQLVKAQAWERQTPEQKEEQRLKLLAERVNAPYWYPGMESKQDDHTKQVINTQERTHDWEQDQSQGYGQSM